MHISLPSQARLRELLDYDPLSGGLVRKAKSNRTDLAGQPAGTKAPGYIRVHIGGKYYAAHRLIWVWMTGDDPGDLKVDHIDCDRHNNRWDNLRLASITQLRSECRFRSRLGLPRGVKFSKGRFGARIVVDKVDHWLGTFDTPEEAHQAYLAAAADLQQPFAA